jgi:pimeloyl-ACP methyl ester carboxylesterase
MSASQRTARRQARRQERHLTRSHPKGEHTSRSLTLRRQVAVVAGVALGAVACLSAAVPATASSAGTRATAEATVLPNSSLSGPGAFLGRVRQVPVDGIKIGYRQFGSGPDLIMVTGDTATMSEWTINLLSQLSHHYRVTIFDNRGVGYTTDDTAVPDTIPLMADDTVGLIKTLGLRHPTLLGWSMGGEIGLTVAALHPGVISALVTTGSDLGGRQAVPRNPAVMKEVNSPETTPLQRLNLLFPAEAGAAKLAYVKQLEQIPQEKISPQTMQRQYQAKLAFYSFEGTWNKLPDSGIPILVTNGTLDVINPAGNASIIADRAAHATRVMFAGAGHGMLFQDTDKFVTLVTQFTEAREAGLRTCTEYRPWYRNGACRD